MTKELIEEKYRAACGIKDDYKFTTDEEYLINEIFKAYNKGHKLPIHNVVGRSEQLCGCENTEPPIDGWVKCKDCGDVFMI